MKDGSSSSSRRTKASKNQDYEELSTQSKPSLVEFKGSDLKCKAEEIGSGGTATVYKVIIQGHCRAVKFFTSKEYQRFYREMKLLSTLQHPNIISLIGYCKDTPGLVYEYHQYTLQNLLGEGKLDWERICRIVLNVAEGLSYLHTQGIRHLDIKPANILIAQDSTAKIIDFGSACQGANSVKNLDGFTPLYVPAEIFIKREISAKTDVYALGVTLLQMTRDDPFLDKDVISDIMDSNEIGKVINGRIGDLSEEKKHLVIALVRKCLSHDPATRPTANELKNLILNLMERLGETAQKQRSIEPGKYVPRFRRDESTLHSTPPFAESADRKGSRLLDNRGAPVTPTAEATPEAAAVGSSKYVPPMFRRAMSSSQRSSQPSEPADRSSDRWRPSFGSRDNPSKRS